MQAANIGWRIAQSISDDVLITLIAVALAVPTGILPEWASLREVFQRHSASSDLFGELSRMIPRLAVLYGVYWAVKLVYHIGFLTLGHGQTPACRLFRLSVVRTDGFPVTWRAAAGRTIAGGMLAQAPLVGSVLRIADYATALFNPRKQALRDMAAGTMLVHNAVEEKGTEVSGNG